MRYRPGHAVLMIVIVLIAGVFGVTTSPDAVQAECAGGLPISTHWVWSGDGREGGSQASLTVRGDTLSIAPVGFVFFTNPDVNYGDGEYCFRYYGTQFVLGWKIDPRNPSSGSELNAQVSFHFNNDLAVGAVNWWGSYFQWHNGFWLCGETAGIQQPELGWHDVSIMDTGSLITVTLDGVSHVAQYSACYEAAVVPGYVGIGSQGNLPLTIVGLRYSTGPTAVQPHTWGGIKARYR